MSPIAEITSDPQRLVRNSIKSNNLNRINSSFIDLDYMADQGNQNSAALTDQDSGKEATIHDFLSLSGSAINTTSAILTVAKNGSQSSSVRTQDLLQPLQKHLTPTANKGLNLSPNGFSPSVMNTQNNTSDYSCSQQIPYAIVNEARLESASNHHSKYKSANASFLPNSRAAHTTLLNKRWQKGGLEMADGNKRIRPLSEDEDEDDEESMDPYGYNSRKEEHFHKFSVDRAQQEGRNMESNDKGMTPRSKHSATEQRRRSKINDRFLMLRQMLPNSDQKRDKASFLLEVIQYIQMLHEKLRKYEAEERGLSQKERTKPISWDMASRHKETIQNNLYIPSISTLSYNSREVSDSNGCAQRSPLTTSENTVSGSELMSNNVANDSKPFGNKPALVTFHQPQSMVYHANGHYHDEVKAKSSLLSLQQSNNLVSETSTYALDHEYEEFKSLGDIVVSNKRRSTNELQDGKRSNNQFMELQATDIMKNSTKDSEHVYDEIKDERRDSLHHYNRVKCEKMPENSEGSTPTILGGVINISSAYSQGLLNTLTKALQSSGIDLDQARISVQIDLGKPYESNLSKVATSSSLSKELDDPQEPRKRPKFEMDI